MGKLKKCIVRNHALKNINRERDELIKIISSKSDRYGDKLIDFMDAYDLLNLQEATVPQLREYIATHYPADISPTQTTNHDHTV